jgi:hypothetical protein
MDIQDYNDKIDELEIALLEIDALGKTYLDGNKYILENKPALEALLEGYKQQKNNLISRPITVEECNEMIRYCIESEKAALQGKEYTLDGRSLVRASLNDIRALKNEYIAKKSMIENDTKDGAYMYRIIPRND